MIIAENLCRHFGTNVALDNVSFKVDDGEIVGLLGPNGAGKTTLMRVLTGYLPPTAGRAIVAGRDVQEDPIGVRKVIGYLPETVPVYAELTVREYLKFVAELHELPRVDLDRRVEECMIHSGIADVSHRIIGHLSKGYRQRVGLAQALVHNPDILILDEPTVGLDPRQVVEIRQLIRQLAQRRTVILSSHILPEVSQICSRVIVIDSGRILAIDTQEELERRVKGTESLYVELKAPSSEAVDAIRALPGVKTAVATEKGGIAVDSEIGRDLREDISSLSAERNWPIIELRPVSMSLEEVFLRLTTREDAGGAGRGQQ